MSRIALIGENSIEYVSTLLDIWNSGDCAVLIDWRIPIQTAVEMMNEAEVHVCYIEKKYYGKVSGAAVSMHYIKYSLLPIPLFNFQMLIISESVAK